MTEMQLLISIIAFGIGIFWLAKYFPNPEDYSDTNDKEQR